MDISSQLDLHQLPFILAFQIVPCLQYCNVRMNSTLATLTPASPLQALSIEAMTTHNSNTVGMNLSGKGSAKLECVADPLPIPQLGNG